MSKVLCILGMHRSGTSIVANLLHESGLHLGKNLLGADFSNTRGHFEDLDILNMHKEVLADQGLAPSGLELNRPPVPPDDFRSRIINISEQRSSYDQWGWKDPRTVLFIDEYLEVFPEMKILLVLRSYRSVLRSLVNRDLARKQLTTSLANLKWKVSGKKQTRLMLREVLPEYRETAKIYYSCLLELLTKAEPDRIQPMILKDYQSTPGLFERLESWGFKLSQVSIGEIADPKYKARSFLTLDKIERNPELELLESKINEILQNRYSPIIA